MEKEERDVKLATKTVESAQAVSNQWYTLRAVADGSRITAQYTYDGSTTTLTVDDASFTSGRAGFRINDTTVSGHYHVDGVHLIGRTAYAYDRANQLTRITDASGVTSAFRYDESGNTLFDAGSHSTYAYNEINRLTSAASLLRGSVSYSYDALGRLAARSPGAKVTFSDDFSGTLEGWNPYDAGWSRVDDAGNAVYRGTAAGASVSWRGDATADISVAVKVRIDSTTDNSGTAGLILRSGVQPGGLDKSQYYFGIYPNEDKWKLFVTNASGGFTLIHSDAHQIELGQFYTLKATAITINGQTDIVLFIDGVQEYSGSTAGPLTGKAGLRVRAATAIFDDFSLESLSPAARASRYLYNEVTGALMHELDGEGNITATYVTDEKGDPVSITRFFDDNGTPASATYFYHLNVHGDVVAITDESGQQVATFSYDAWGVPTEYNAAGAIVEIGSWTAESGGAPGDGLFLLFGGMLYDAMAGLYITKTRAYNPKTERFLQRDILDEQGKDGVYAGFPFGQDAIGSNLYAWCKNNPVNMVDPSGEFGLRNLIRRAANFTRNFISNPRAYINRAAGVARGAARGAVAYAKVASAAVQVAKAVQTVTKSVVGKFTANAADVSFVRDNPYGPRKDKVVRVLYGGRG
ncbi:MAG: hypothetical protein C4534_03580 [Gaiellales bacterium]|nr:MAG: hypothetical protein C4534_03580 [Gaiellales bacterium]